MSTKKRNQTVTIKSNEENPEPIEIIAQSIINVATAFEKISQSRLSKRAVVLLIKDATRNISINDIEVILDVVPRLKDIYLKKVLNK